MIAACSMVMMMMVRMSTPGPAQTAAVCDGAACPPPAQPSPAQPSPAQPSQATQTGEIWRFCRETDNLHFIGSS